MEEQQGRMMLYPQQNYGMGGMGGEESLATSPAPTQGDENQQQRQHADINTILDQVLSFDLDTMVGNNTSMMDVAPRCYEWTGWVGLDGSPGGVR